MNITKEEWSELFTTHRYVDFDWKKEPCRDKHEVAVVILMLMDGYGIEYGFNTDDDANFNTDDDANNLLEAIKAFNEWKPPI